MTDSYNIAVAGATGAVGTVMLKLLQEREFPVASLRPLASERSAGQTVEFGGEELEVQELTADSFQGIDIALFSAGGDRSKQFAPAAVTAGAVVVDNSGAFRMDPNVPLVVPEVNPEDLKWHEGIIANPNCSTIQMVVPLKPIYDAVGIERIVVTTFQSVSGTGNRAIEELFNQTEAVIESGEGEVQKDVYPHQIAFNILPHIDYFHDNGYTNEEMKMINETRKIFGDPELRVTATCTRVPVFSAHSESVNIQTSRPVSVDEVRRLLLATPGIALVDDPGADEYPMPLMAEGKDEVFVGRIRKDYSAENSLNFWMVSDNLRKGAATNAVQIAELLIREELLQ
ncbi:aspartate-semialdehyde dehydrogenase [bacterium BMS3Abin01]|nr:aspartate-semialdehyde dehydrogenase [bacterium BMS3Abin01]HDZ59216.1 aspartate-semialdehyde dehydrogenase [Actinomycetota bacterium]